MGIRQSVTWCISGLILTCTLVTGVSSAAEFSAGPGVSGLWQKGAG